VTVAEAIAIAASGVAAGTINTVVGSGTLLTFTVLLGFGYAPVVANVSNTGRPRPRGCVGHPRLPLGARRAGEAGGRVRSGLDRGGDHRRRAPACASGLGVQGDRAVLHRVRARPGRAPAVAECPARGAAGGTRRTRGVVDPARPLRSRALRRLLRRRAGSAAAGPARPLAQRDAPACERAEERPRDVDQRCRGARPSSSPRPTSSGAWQGSSQPGRSPAARQERAWHGGYRRPGYAA